MDRQRMLTQSVEFDKAEELKEQMERLFATAPVDDDYPEVRLCYESALTAFIEAMKANGRFNKGNLYGLEIVHGD